MTTAMLVHHLLAMFASVPRVHWSLIGFYTRQQPGLAGVSWVNEVTGRHYGTGYPGLIRSLIWQYPHAMQACAASFRGYAPTMQSYRICP